MKTITGKTALITGGSSGIGLAMAKRMAGMGANIWVLARDPVKLEAACAEIERSKQSAGQQIRTISADIANYEQLSQALTPILLESGTPDILVNSAGITYPGYFQDLDLQVFRDNMEINYFGTLYVTKLLVPGMIQRGSGMIINISSLVGMHGLLGYSAYAASKFAVTGLSDALRYDLKPHGIQVSVAFPTDTLTPQLEFESKLKPAVLKALTDSNNTPVPPDVVAKNILDDALKGRYFILPTSDMRLLFIVKRLFPGESLYKIVDFLINQARKKVEKEGALEKKS